MHQSLISLLALAACVNAGTPHIIDVGKGGALTFSPDSLTAAVGDTLEFHFYSGSGGHSVASSTLESPCVPAPDAFFSGFQKADTTGDTTFVVNVTSTDPIWYYCSLSSHCQAGMVGVVNPPSGKTITDYTDAAKKVAQASSPATMAGGVLTSINEAAESTMVGTSSSAITGSGGPLQPATTTTSTGTSATSVQTGVQASPTSSTSTGATPSPTKSEARKGSDLSILLGLSVVVGGLVVLMA
ncbi:Cupredoxin [Hyaloscypha bicolor E]|uniref:Cupredoxin n=1 Tax=Hyaloscypha bicolor E TaxID=1095630 RepID=A0A2J6TRN1_9HELO|nr:Cupredoxin [Hyaloscypha bicolor E]PMD65674.1 Cupredoxin [Hyaloscypha bicolor E]